MLIEVLTETQTMRDVGVEGLDLCAGTTPEGALCPRREDFIINSDPLEIRFRNSKKEVVE
jgi:hypothetical protein